MDSNDTSQLWFKVRLDWFGPPEQVRITRYDKKYVWEFVGTTQRPMEPIKHRRTSQTVCFFPTLREAIEAPLDWLQQTLSKREKEMEDLLERIATNKELQADLSAQLSSNSGKFIPYREIDFSSIVV